MTREPMPMVVERKMEGVDLSHQLDRFITDNHHSHCDRARYASQLASEFKAKVDLLRDRGLVLPADLQMGLDQMRLGELQEQRRKLRQQLDRLDREERQIARSAAS